MAKVRRIITVSAPVEEVFAYISNPANELEWLTSICDIRDITGQGVGQRYGFTYKMSGLPLEGESEVVEYIPNRRYVTRSRGDISSTWTWTFGRHDGGTLLSVVVEFMIPVPVLGKVGEKLAMGQVEREASVAVVNIRERLEG